MFRIKICGRLQSTLTILKAVYLHKKKKSKTFLGLPLPFWNEAAHFPLSIFYGFSMLELLSNTLTMTMQ